MFLVSQVKLRAACLGVKIRAENGLDRTLDSLSLFLRSHRPPRPSPPPPPPPHCPAIHGVTVDASHDAKMPRWEGLSFGHGTRNGLAGEGEVSTTDLSGGNLRETREDGNDGGDVTLTKLKREEKLVLREMTNGVKVWSGASAEEETVFVYDEVFEERTYARMGIRVEDGDTVWDVGETGVR